MTAIIVIASVVGLVWGTVFLMRGSLLGGCVAFLVATSCFSGTFFSFDAAGLTWSLDRFFLVTLVIAYFVQRRLGRTEGKPLSKVEYLLGIYFVMLIASTFTHDWRTSAGELPVLMHLVNGYMIPLTIYWIARHASLNERSLRTVYVGLALFGVYLSVTGILEMTGQWSLVFPRYIGNSEIGLHWGRARGPYLQAATFGMYLTLCLLATWFAWGRMLHNARAKRWLPLALSPLYVLAIGATLTRGAWAGSAAAFIVVCSLMLRGRWRHAFLVVVAVSVLAVGLTKGDSLVAFKRDTSAQITRKSTYSRLAFTYVSWLMFKERPLTGFGFGQFPRESGAFLNDRATTIYLEEIRGYIHHNTLLCILVELGIFGFLVFLAVLAWWVHSNWRLWSDPTAPAWMRAHALLFLAAMAPYSVQLLFRDVTYSPNENAVMFLLAGITSGLTAMRAGQQQVPTGGNNVTLGRVLPQLNRANSRCRSK